MMLFNEPNYPGVLKVISGGQTGADRGGLEAARAIGLATGGTAPRDFMTANGSDYTLQSFGLVAVGNYRTRTIKNIKDSDGTVIFAHNVESLGTVLTLNQARANKKPVLVLEFAKDSSTADVQVMAERLADFVKANRIMSLNVAGNREIKGSNLVQCITMAVLVIALSPE